MNLVPERVNSVPSSSRVSGVVLARPECDGASRHALRGVEAQVRVDAVDVLSGGLGAHAGQHLIARAREHRDDGFEQGREVRLRVPARLPDLFLEIVMELRR